MHKPTILFAAVAALLGTAVIVLYRQNGAIGREIGGNAEQCRQRIAKLEGLYQTEIDDLRRYLLEQYNRDPDAAPAQAEKPRFNKLVSHGHRMQAIGSKYEFLLQSALLDPAGKQQLRRLLFEWEQKADAVQAGKEQDDSNPATLQRLQSDLEDVEARVRALLTDTMDHDHFVMLRQRNL